MLIILKRKKAACPRWKQPNLRFKWQFSKAPVFYLYKIAGDSRTPSASLDGEKEKEREKKKRKIIGFFLPPPLIFN